MLLIYVLHSARKLTLGIKILIQICVKDVIIPSLNMFNNKNERKRYLKAYDEWIRFLIILLAIKS